MTYSISSCESSRRILERWATTKVPEWRSKDGQELGSYDQNTTKERHDHYYAECANIRTCRAIMFVHMKVALSPSSQIFLMFQHATLKVGNRAYMTTWKPRESILSQDTLSGIIIHTLEPSIRQSYGQSHSSAYSLYEKLGVVGLMTYENSPELPT